VPGASGIENMDEPGGGKRVRLTEPNGYQIEVVWGMKEVPELPAPRQVLNSGYAPLARPGALMRLPKGPSRVKRIAHCVLGTPKVNDATSGRRSSSTSILAAQWSSSNRGSPSWAP